MILNLPLSEQFARLADRYVDLDAAASILEETKSAVLSQMVMTVIQAEPSISMAKAETVVKSGQKWTDHVTKMVNARTEANKAKLHLEAMRMRFWESQSSAANERLQSRI